MTRPVTPKMIRNARARDAAERALGESVALVVSTSVMQTYMSPSGRVVHVWTFADEFRVEVPRMSIDPGNQKVVAP
jgi:hypothetical protein